MAGNEGADGMRLCHMTRGRGGFFAAIGVVLAASATMASEDVGDNDVEGPDASLLGVAGLLFRAND